MRQFPLFGGTRCRAPLQFTIENVHFQSLPWPFRLASARCRVYRARWLLRPALLLPGLNFANFSRHFSLSHTYQPLPGLVCFSSKIKIPLLSRTWRKRFALSSLVLQMAHILTGPASLIFRFSVARLVFLAAIHSFISFHSFHSFPGLVRLGY